MSDVQRAMSQRRVLRAVSSCLAACLLVGMSTVALGQPRGPAEPPTVKVARVTLASFPLTIEAVGTARANESVEIRPQLTETITEIRFTEGARVAGGDVLLELEDQQTRAALAQARAALVDSDSQYRRANELFETRAVSASELERLEAQRDADRAAVEAAEARLEETVIRAPFDGRVGLRNVSRGALVTPQTVITTLDDTDIIKLDFAVPETALAQVAPGLSVRARSAAWRDREFAGEVATVDTRVDPVSRTVTARALVDNAEGLLRPGMFLTVELRREDISALLIPEQAVVPDRSRQFVFVLEGTDRVVQREIRTGRRQPGSVEIVSGLGEGETVVAEGTHKLRDGDTVRVLGRLETWP